MFLFGIFFDCVHILRCYMCVCVREISIHTVTSILYGQKYYGNKDVKKQAGECTQHVIIANVQSD